MRRILLWLALMLAAFTSMARAQGGTTQCWTEPSEQVASFINLGYITEVGGRLVLADSAAEVYYHEKVHQRQIAAMGCEAASRLSPIDWAYQEVEAYCESAKYAVRRGENYDARLTLYTKWITSSLGVPAEQVRLMFVLTCRRP